MHAYSTSSAILANRSPLVVITDAFASAFFASGFLAAVLADSSALTLLAVVLDARMFADAAATAVFASVLVAAMDADAHTSAFLAKRLAPAVRALSAHAAVFLYGGHDAAAICHRDETIRIQKFFDLHSLRDHFLNGAVLK